MRYVNSMFASTLKKNEIWISPAKNSRTDMSYVRDDIKKISGTLFVFAILNMKNSSVKKRWWALIDWSLVREKER